MLDALKKQTQEDTDALTHDYLQLQQDFKKLEARVKTLEMQQGMA